MMHVIDIRRSTEQPCMFDEINWPTKTTYTQQKKFCKSGCLGKFCLDQEWLHLMLYIVF